MYKISLSREAEKELNHLRRSQPKHARQLKEKIDSLTYNPRPQDSKKVITRPGYLRVDSGEYRIFYKVFDNRKEIEIYEVKHRKDAFRW